MESLFNKLKEQGIEKIALLISDASYGIQRVFNQTFIGTSWAERCMVLYV